MNRLRAYYLRVRRWGQYPYTVQCEYGHTTRMSENASGIKRVTILCKPEDADRVTEVLDAYLEKVLKDHE